MLLVDRRELAEVFSTLSRPFHLSHSALAAVAKILGHQTFKPGRPCPSGLMSSRESGMPPQYWQIPGLVQKGGCLHVFM